MVRRILFLLAFDVLLGCAVRTSRASSQAAAPATPAESSEWGLRPAFARCPAVERTAFDGAYVVATEAQGDDLRRARILEQLAGFEVDRGHIRAGVPLRNDYCFTRVSEQSDSQLIAEALWHEDVLDPGDASLVHVGLRRAGAQIAFVVGETEAEVRAQLLTVKPNLTRAEGDVVIGERYEASRTFVDLWNAPHAPQGAPCVRAASMPHSGRYRVDVDASLGAAHASLAQNRKQMEEALLLSSVADLVLDEAGLEFGLLREGACWLAVEPRTGGFEAEVRTRGQYDEESASWHHAFVRVTGDGARLRLRIAKERGALDAQPEIALERIGPSPGLAGWVTQAPRPRSFPTRFFALGKRSVLMVAGDAEDVLSRTTDGGTTWVPLPWSHGRVTAALGRERELWIATQGTLWHSADDGATFASLPLPTRDGGLLMHTTHTSQMLWSSGGKPWITLPDRIATLEADGSFATLWQMGDQAAGVLVYSYPIENGGVLVSANPFQLYRGRSGKVRLESEPGPTFEAPQGLSGVIELAKLPSGEVGISPLGTIFVRRRGRSAWEVLEGIPSCGPRVLAAVPGKEDEVLVGCDDNSIHTLRLDGHTHAIFAEKVAAELLRSPVNVDGEVWFSYYRATEKVGGIAVSSDGSVRRISVPAPPAR